MLSLEVVAEVVVVVVPDSEAVLYIRDAMIDVIINEGIMNIMLNASFKFKEVKTTAGTATMVTTIRDMTPSFQRRRPRSRILPLRSRIRNTPMIMKRRRMTSVESIAMTADLLFLRSVVLQDRATGTHSEWIRVIACMKTETLVHHMKAINTITPVLLFQMVRTRNIINSEANAKPKYPKTNCNIVDD